MLRYAPVRYTYSGIERVFQVSVVGNRLFDRAVLLPSAPQTGTMARI
jgi:hypothetical protein